MQIISCIIRRISSESSELALHFLFIPYYQIHSSRVCFLTFNEKLRGTQFSFLKFSKKKNDDRKNIIHEADKV